LLLAGGHRSDDHERWRNKVLERVAYASVFVSDQDRALDFYTNVLGFEPRFDIRHSTDRGS
jgi:Glyoxalase/Bleomycin resistance protein/Dioxygenase superfamily